MHFKNVSGSHLELEKVSCLMREGDIRAHIKKTLESAGASVMEYDFPNSAAGWGNGHLKSSGVVLVDIAGQKSPETTLSDIRARCHEKTVLVALGDATDISFYRHIKRYGADEYFHHPVDAGELSEFVRNCQAPSENEHRGVGKTIAVYGVKGGVGSGMITAGIADIIAHRQNLKTIVVDSDMASPSVGSWFGIDKPGKLRNLATDPKRLDLFLLEQVIQSMDRNLSVVDGYAPLETELWRQETIEKLIALLASRFAYQIWRTEGGGEAVGPCLSSAHVVITVADNTLASLRGSLSASSWLKENNPNCRNIVVFNQARARGPLTLEAFIKVFGRRPDHVIPYHRNLGEQQLDGMQFHEKRHTLHKTLLALAGEAAGVSIQPTSWWRRIWS